MAGFTMPAPTAEEMRRGLIALVVSVAVFAAVNAVVKWLVARYSVFEIVVFRAAFSLIPCAYSILAHRGEAILRTRRLHQHVIRAALQFVSMCCIFTAFGLLPLADAVAITFSSPLFLTILSIPFLGEIVRLHRWSAVVVGLIGVLIMVRPGAGVFQAGALFALANALINAGITIAIRRMTLTEHTTALVFYQTLVTGALGLIALPFVWQPPGLFDLALLVFVGLASGVGQFLWTQGCRFVPAAVAAPFSYTAMVWALGFGYLIWGDVPSLPVFVGAGIVILSGLYILYRETVRRSAKPNLAAAGND